MSIPVECPHEGCTGSFKVKDHVAGKKIRCRECQKVIRVPIPKEAQAELQKDAEPAAEVELGLPNIDEMFPQIPQEELEPAPQNESTWKPAGDTAADDLDDDEWVTPLNIGAEDEEPIEDPDTPFPDEEDPTLLAVDEKEASQVNVSLGTVFDFSLDAAMITYVLHWVGISTAVALLAAALAFLIPVIGIFIGGGLLGITLIYAWLALISGIGHLTGLKLSTNETPNVNDAWSMFLKRAISLSFGSVGVWFLSVFIIGLIAALVFAVSNTPYVGQLIGGVLLIPTFIGVIFAMALMANMYLIPVVIGVENCSAMEAFKILRTLTRKNGFALYLSYFRAIWMIIPTMFWAVLLIVGPLAASLALCGSKVASEGPGIMSCLLVLSTAAIILSALAFGIVMVTVTLSLVYCTRTSRVIVT